jgi:VWFA-related protein
MYAQSPAASRQRFAINTTAVIVDVVVTDAKGTPVVDLQKRDFEILENGVAQTITGFTPPLSAASAPSMDRESRPAVNPAVGPTRSPTTYLALVFGRLTPEGRQVAYRAAMARIDALGSAASEVGVFATDRAFLTIQAFTSDRDTLRSGVRRAGTRATKGPLGQSPGAEYGSLGDLQQLSVDDAAQAQVALLGLIGVVRNMAPLDGHKAVLYFTDTFSVDPGLEPYFQDLIELANRNNVTFYAVDTAGLRTQSSQQVFGSMLNENARRALESGVGGRRGRSRIWARCSARATWPPFSAWSARRQAASPSSTRTTCRPVLHAWLPTTGRGTC